MLTAIEVMMDEHMSESPKLSASVGMTAVRTQKALGVSFFPRMPRSIRLAGPSGLPLHELDYRNLGFLLQRNSARHCCIGSSGWSDGWLLRNPRMLEVDFGVVRAIRRQNLVQEGVGGLGTQRSVESDPPSVTQFV